jgi:hypothetical protein
MCHHPQPLSRPVGMHTYEVGTTIATAIDKSLSKQQRHKPQAAAPRAGIYEPAWSGNIAEGGDDLDVLIW